MTQAHVPESSSSSYAEAVLARDKPKPFVSSLIWTYVWCLVWGAAVILAFLAIVVFFMEAFHTEPGHPDYTPEGGFIRGVLVVWGILSVGMLVIAGPALIWLRRLRPIQRLSSALQGLLAFLTGAAIAGLMLSLLQLFFNVTSQF